MNLEDNMAKCRVLLDYAGWNKGDKIEAFGNRLTELTKHGIVQIIEDNTPPLYISKKDKQKGSE